LRVTLTLGAEVSWVVCLTHNVTGPIWQIFLSPPVMVFALIFGIGLVMVGVPPEGIGLILGVDRFLDMCRTHAKRDW